MAGRFDDELGGLSAPLLARGSSEEPGETAAAATTTPMNPTTSVSFEFIDHFSLRRPSSTIRSRGATTRVYDVNDDQLQLDQRSEIVRGGERGDENQVRIVTRMKRLGGGASDNPGLIFLRVCYTLVALLVAGFTFVFAANVIAMQAMEIPRNAGEAAGASLNVPVMLANLLSLPLLVYSMASLMIFAAIFVVDAWRGHETLRLLLPARVPRVYLEWYSFVLYLGLPALILSVAALGGAEDPKEVGGLAWYWCVLSGLLVFCALVFYNEIKLCLDLTQLWHPELRNVALLKRAVLTTLTQRYCGVEKRYLSVRQGWEPTASALNDAEPLRTYQSIYSRLTSLSGNPFFTQVDPPHRRYSVQELRETVPVVTNNSWGLEKACCGLSHARSQYVVRGPDALERRQAKSGLICSILGINLGCLVAVAVLYRGGVLSGAAGIVVVYMVALILIGLPCIWSAYQAYRATALPQVATDDEDNADEAVLQTWISFIVAKPKERYCWSRLILAFGLFFVWPAISLFAEGLPKAGVLFLLTSIFSGARLNLDAASIVRDKCPLSEVNFGGGDKSSQHQMLDRARAAQVLGKITNSTFYFIFIITFGIMGGYFVYSASLATGSGEDYHTQGGRPPILLLDDFYYPPQTDDILYPNCKITDKFSIPGLDNTYALDYNFLAGIAYETTNVTSYVVDKWFLQKDVPVDEADFVKQWRQNSGNSEEQVSFKLFSFPSSPGAGILSIRGTETPMDRLFNTQMYLGPVLTSLVRALMPFSWIWDSIYDDLLLTTSWVASDHLKKSDYYRITTDFANDLLRNNYTIDGKSFQWLRTTGVSAGGANALITGAQTEAWGFAYSGPNPTLARKTFDPPITMQQLKEKVINIKPENDFVSSIGDLVPNHQLVRCRDWPANYHNCHSFWRIFCEYLYTCGSCKDRAGAFCVCVYDWGYPEPIPRGNRTFDQACDEEKAAIKDSLGDIFKD